MTLAGSGTFIFSAANSESGSIVVASVGATLTLSGPNGSLRGMAGLTLDGGSVLNLDSSAGNEISQDRIADSLALIGNGGALNLIGNSSAATTETLGTLVLGSARRMSASSPAARKRPR